MNVKNGVVVALLCGLVGMGTAASYAAQAAQMPPKSFLVLLGLGPGYDNSLPIQQQKGFPAHAAYMNELEGKGKLVFGGRLLESFASMQPTGAVSLCGQRRPTRRARSPLETPAACSRSMRCVHCSWPWRQGRSEHPVGV